MPEIHDLWPVAPSSETDWLTELCGDGTLGFGDIDLEIGIATGGGLGRAEHPGPQYRRLRWAELSARCGNPVIEAVRLPWTT